MSNVKFLSFNLATQETTIATPSSENALYSISNLRDHRTTKKFRSQTASVNIVFDFITTENINSFAIKGDKFTGFGFNGSITLELNATDEWSSPAFTTTITPNTQHNIGYKSFSDQAYRFARLVITGTSYVELSNIFIGEHTQLSQNNIDFGWSYLNKDQSSITTTKDGQQFSTTRPHRKEIKANFKLLNKSEFNVISDLSDFHGKTEPVWFIVDESETIVDTKERFINQFFFSSSLGFKNSSFQLFDTAFRLRETI